MHVESNSAGYLLSTSKDGLLKLWDLSLQHCVETVVHGSNEIWSLAVSQDVPLAMQVSAKGKESTEDDDEATDRNAFCRWRALVLTGSADGDMKVWEISAEALSRGLQTVSAADNSASAPPKSFSSQRHYPASASIVSLRLNLWCTKAPTQCHRISICTRQGYIAVSSTDKAVQVFRLRSTQEDGQEDGASQKA